MSAALMPAAAGVILVACTVGPDYVRPPPPELGEYTPEALPANTASADTAFGAAQGFARDLNIPADWWTLFESASLNALIGRALAANPGLEAAEAALSQAREHLLAGRAARAPSLDAGAAVTRRRFVGAGFGQPDVPAALFTLYHASVELSYDTDLFDKQSKALEVLAAQVETARFRHQAARLSLTANVVTHAVRELALREQIIETEAIAADERQRLDLLRQDYALGAVSRATLIGQKARLAELLASLPPLKQDLALTRHQLAVLAGQLPGEPLPETFRFDAMRLPDTLPVSLPARLVRQRPDIRIAEALLHAAHAQIGVAVANMLPRVTLTGSYGSLAAGAGELFSAASMVWALGAGLSQPVFRRGELKHEKQAAVAAHREAAARYRHTVLHAFREVADALQAIQFGAEALAAQSAAEGAALEHLDLAEKQFRLGAIAHVDLLDARRRYHQAKIALIEAQAARLADTAALFHALGGGWWNEDE